MQSTFKYLIISIITLLVNVQFLFLTRKLILLSPLDKQLLLLTGLGILSFLLAVKNKRFLPKKSFTGILLVFVAWVLMSGLWAVNGSLIWPVFLGWVIIFMVYIVSVSLPKDILNSPTLGIIILCVISLNVLETYLVYFKALAKNDWRLSLYIIESSVSTFYVNTNQLGSLFLLYILILKAIPFTRRLNYIAIGIIYLAACLIPLLNSRAVSIALTFVAIFYCFNSFKNGYFKKYLIFLFITLISSFLLYQFLISNKERFKEKYEPLRELSVTSGNDRLELWRNSLMLIKEKPLLGSGAGNWFVEIKKYGLNDYNHSNNYSHAHNVWVETATELGIIGLLLLMGLGGSALLVSIKLRKWNLLALIISVSILLSFYGLYKPRSVYLSSYYIITFCWVGLSLRTFERFKISMPFNMAYFFVIVFSFYLCFSLTRFNQYTKRLKRANKDTLEEEIIEWDKYYKPWLTTFERGVPSIVLKSNHLWKIGRKNQAIHVLNNAILLDPHAISIWFVLGQRYESKNDWENAGKCYLYTLDLYKKYTKAALALTNVGIKSSNGMFFSEGIKFYYNNVSPDFEKNYSDDFLINENKRIANFWKTRCKQIDTYQGYLEKWQSKQMKLKK